MITSVILSTTLGVSSAYADSIYVVSKTPVYKTETIYETVEVCEDRGDNVLGGALLGGLIGNNSGDGNAAEGAILGGILGGLVSGESCRTERRAVGTTQVYVHTEYVISLNGMRYTLTQ